MIIPNYEIFEKIATSQQATIYKAYHKKNPNRLLVLKVLKAIGLSDYKKIQFRQKIEHLRVLNDPMVITPMAFDVKDEIGFLAQDYFDEIPLNELMETRSISLNDFFTIACGLTLALDKAHEAGIIHGGVKPALASEAL